MLIVAEVGVNHDGRVEKALQMIDVAAAAGADAVKFQMVRAADLVTGSAPTTTSQQRGCTKTTQKEMLTPLELSQSAFVRIQEHCRRRDVLFLATPFGPADVTRLVDLGVPAIKIASIDLPNSPLLERVAATGLPMILSTGASTEAEIKAGVGLLGGLSVTERLVLLHCVSCYPAPTDALNLRAIATLTRLFGVPCGLSDHTTSTRTGAWAVAVGACLLEKHLTLDRASPGPDHAMSLDPDGLAEYIAGVRQAERTLGDGRIGMLKCEGEVRDLARKSIVAAADIRRDTVLTAEMLGLKRPGTGLPPRELGRLVGCRVVVDIPCDTSLSWDMVR